MTSVFQAWVEAYGNYELAAKLKISPRTVNHWVNCDAYPKVDTMRELVKLSKGELTYEIIIDSCQPKGDRK